MEKDEEESDDLTSNYGSRIKDGKQSDISDMKIKTIRMENAMNDESQILMEQLVDAIKHSQEYNRYQSLLENVKKHPDIYHRIGEFRRRSIMFQTSDHVNAIDENNALQKEFADLQNNGLANEFMAAEHQYCQMIRKLQGYFLDHLDLELDFLND